MKAVGYKGETKAGHRIAFKHSGSRLKGVSTMVLTICLSTSTGVGTTRAGPTSTGRAAA